jgi:uncharacterized protein involved in outer membrane biogenesis
MRWKWILGGAASVIVLLMVAVYVILSSYNFNDFKPRVAQAVKDATGRELKLDGDISLKLGLIPSLIVARVSFQNAPWGSRPELATVKRVEVQVALIPLIGKRIEVKRLVLEEPDILIETDHSGISNLAFETAGKMPAAQPIEGGVSSGGKTVALMFHEVRIENGRISYRDGQSGKTHALALEKASMSTLAADSPVQLAFKGAFNDKPLEVAGTVGSLLELTDSAKAWPVKLTGKAGGASLTVDGDLRNALGARSFAINIDARGPSIPEVVKLAGIAGLPEVGPFSVKGKVVGQGSQLSIEKIEVEAGTEDLAKVTFAGAIKDPLAQRGIEIDFKIQGKELAKLGQLAGQSSNLKGPFQISGHAVDSAEKTYKVSELKVALEEIDLSGVVELKLTGKKPRIEASLLSQKLDLRPFLPKDEKKGSEAGKSQEAKVKRDRVFPNNPLPMPGLNNADAALQIRAGQVITPRLALSDLTINLGLEDGVLTLKPLKGNLGGGSFDAHLNLAPKGKALGLQAVVKVHGLNLGRVSKDLAGSEKLNGNLDLDLDVRGAGASIAELMAGLSGKMLLVGGNMRIDNKYLDLLGADISGSALRLLNPLSREENYTEIKCFVSGFDIRDGIAQSTALVFDTKHMTVVGEGKVNLRTEQLDIALKPSPKEGAGFAGLGKVGLSAGELAKAFKLSGTLAKPSLAIDPTQSALVVGKAVGGAALFGPAGIAASLAQGSSGNENPCLAAIDAAKKGVKPGDGSGEARGLVDKTTEGAKGAVKGAGDKLKKMFGR